MATFRCQNRSLAHHGFVDYTDLTGTGCRNVLEPGDDERIQATVVTMHSPHVDVTMDVLEDDDIPPFVAEIPPSC